MLLERVLKCKMYIMKAHAIAIAESHSALNSPSSPWGEWKPAALQCAGWRGFQKQPLIRMRAATVEDQTGCVQPVGKHARRQAVKVNIYSF